MTQRFEVNVELTGGKVIMDGMKEMMEKHVEAAESQKWKNEINEGNDGKAQETMPDWKMKKWKK